MISSLYDKFVGTSSSQQSNKPKILCVGLTCLDIVNTCKVYPTEDSDIRSLEHRWQRGGNASNTCTVLSLLGNSCEFLGTLSAQEHLNFLLNDMRKYQIHFSHCPLVENSGCPVSTIVLSLNSGSRTIIHHNPDLPEISFDNFQKINLDEYSWIHFEGRNIVQTICMIQHVESYNKSLIENNNIDQSDDGSISVQIPITISVELEKPKSELIDLLPYADVAFVSKDFAQGRGFTNMSETLKSISEEAKSGATIICAWGDRGAMARTPDGIIVQSPAFPPKKVIDTLGAGDTFNAAVLHHLNKLKLQFIENNEKKKKVDIDLNCDTNDNEDFTFRGKVKLNQNIESLEYCKTEFIDQIALQDAITFGCHIAGTKVGSRGFDGLTEILKNTIL